MSSSYSYAAVACRCCSLTRTRPLSPLSHHYLTAKKPAASASPNQTTINPLLSFFFRPCISSSTRLHNLILPQHFFPVILLPFPCCLLDRVSVTNCSGNITLNFPALHPTVAPSKHPVSYLRRQTQGKVVNTPLYFCTRTHATPSASDYPAVFVSPFDSPPSDRRIVKHHSDISLMEICQQLR